MKIHQGKKKKTLYHKHNQISEGAHASSSFPHLTSFCLSPYIRLPAIKQLMASTADSPKEGTNPLGMMEMLLLSVSFSQQMQEEEVKHFVLSIRWAAWSPIKKSHNFRGTSMSTYL